jgi:hypothetical protein
MPSDVPWLAHAFPFASSVNETAENVRASIVSILPSVEVARSLYGTYYRHAAWMYVKISNMFTGEETFMTPSGIHPSRKMNLFIPSSSPCITLVMMHRLAGMFSQPCSWCSRWALSWTSIDRCFHQSPCSTTNWARLRCQLILC